MWNPKGNGGEKKVIYLFNDLMIDLTCFISRNSSKNLRRLLTINISYLPDEKVKLPEMK